MDFNPNDYVQDGGMTAKMIMERKSLDITDDDMKRAYKKAYLRSVEKFFETAFLREHVRRFAENGDVPIVPDEPVLQKMLIDQADAVSQKPPYLMITINPRHDVSLKDLKKQVEKYIKKKTITHYIYVYEVRKDEEGLHCHIIVKYVDKPYNFKRGTKNTFKHLCDVNNPHILNFKFITEEHLQSKINYLLGDKKDTKKAGVACSEAYRKKHKLEPFYESSPRLPCRDAEIPLIDEPQDEPQEF